jgi:hypothetical protein
MYQCSDALSGIFTEIQKVDAGGNTSIGTFPGEALKINWTNPQTYLVATRESAGCAIHRTTDDGANWEQTSSVGEFIAEMEFDNYSVGGIEVHRVGEYAVMRTTNAGADWTEIASVPTATLDEIRASALLGDAECWFVLKDSETIFYDRWSGFVSIPQIEPADWNYARLIGDDVVLTQKWELRPGVWKMRVLVYNPGSPGWRLVHSPPPTRGLCRKQELVPLDSSGFDYYYFRRVDPISPPGNCHPDPAVWGELRYIEDILE